MKTLIQESFIYPYRSLEELRNKTRLILNKAFDRKPDHVWARREEKYLTQISLTYPSDTLELIPPLYERYGFFHRLPTRAGLKQMPSSMNMLLRRIAEAVQVAEEIYGNKDIPTYLRDSN